SIKKRKAPPQSRGPPQAGLCRVSPCVTQFPEPQLSFLSVLLVFIQDRVAHMAQMLLMRDRQNGVIGEEGAFFIQWPMIEKGKNGALDLAENLLPSFVWGD